VVVGDGRFNLVCVIERSGNLPKDLASPVQLPRDLMRGSSSCPVIAADPRTLPGRAVMKARELLQRLLQRGRSCRQRPENRVDLRRVVDGSRGVREPAQRLLCLVRVRSRVGESGHAVLLLRVTGSSTGRCARGYAWNSSGLSRPHAGNAVSTVTLAPGGK
jgi:hypothetical protein